jgi:hypothetical protein
MQLRSKEQQNLYPTSVTMAPTTQWRSYIVATVALASVEIHQQLAWSTLDLGVALSSTARSESQLKQQ